MEYRAYTAALPTNFNPVTIQIQHTNTSVMWDIYQMAVGSSLASGDPYLICSVYVNGFFNCGSSQAAADTATGPPDIILGATDIMTVIFSGQAGNPGDIAQVGIWYYELPLSLDMELQQVHGR